MKKVVMSESTYLREHDRLVKLLTKTSKLLKNEANEQSNELKNYKKKTSKV
jgi:hypothetical protein